MANTNDAQAPWSFRLADDETIVDCTHQVLQSKDFAAYSADMQIQT